jgi:hypothetical protein
VCAGQISILLTNANANIVFGIEAWDISGVPSSTTHHKKNDRFFKGAKPAYDGNILAKTTTSTCRNDEYQLRILCDVRSGTTRANQSTR